jgi:hypothetical protein
MRMDEAQLALWRDAALVLLAVQAAVVGLLSAVVLYRGIQGLRLLDERLRPVLFELRIVLWRFTNWTQRTMGAIAAPFLWLRSVAAGVLRASQYLGWR